MATNENEHRAYVFGPRETSGWIGNAGPVELVLLTVIVMCGIFILRASSNVWTLLAVLIIGGTALVGTFGRMADRTPLQWLGIARRYWDRRMHGRTQTRMADRAARSGNGTPLADRQLPPSVRSIRMGHFDTAGGRIGVAYDGKAVCAVLSIRGPREQAFSMMSQKDQEELLHQWSQVIGRLCRRGEPIVSLQAIDQTAVGADGKLVNWFQASQAAAKNRQSTTTHHDKRLDLAKGEAPKVTEASAAVKAYQDLIAHETKTAEVHEMCLVIRLDCTRTGRLIRKARINGRGSVEFGQLVLLQRAIFQTSMALQNLGLDVLGVLSPERYALLVNTMLNPGERFAAARRQIAGLNPGLAPISMWPGATDEKWSTFRSDGTISQTAVVGELPQQGVAADFLTPLIMAGGENRVVSVTFTGLDPEVAKKQAQHTSQNREGSTKTKREAGFRTSAAEVAKVTEAQRHEQELANGYDDVRVVVHLTTSAPTRRALDAAIDSVTDSAHASGMRLWTLYGEQEVARTYTLPFGRGIRSIPLSGRVSEEALGISDRIQQRAAEDVDPWEDGALLTEEELAEAEADAARLTEEERATEEETDRQEAAQVEEETAEVVVPVLADPPVEQQPAKSAPAKQTTRKTTTAKRAPRKTAATKPETPTEAPHPNGAHPVGPADATGEVNMAAVTTLLAAGRKSGTRKTAAAPRQRTTTATGSLATWTPTDDEKEGE